MCGAVCCLCLVITSKLRSVTYPVVLCHQTFKWVMLPHCGMQSILKVRLYSLWLKSILEDKVLHNTKLWCSAVKELWQIAAQNTYFDEEDIGGLLYFAQQLKILAFNQVCVLLEYLVNTLYLLIYSLIYEFCKIQLCGKYFKNLF